jgi:hypothetical protein
LGRKKRKLLVALYSYMTLFLLVTAFVITTLGIKGSE